MMVSRHKFGGKPIRALKARLKGKEGRLRGNLMGKRVDFSARTVITPDPTLDLDQLGVPRTIAENITIPEVVTPQNLDELKTIVFNGPNTWPGAKYIIGEGGKLIDLSFARTTETFIDYGYIVERHLRNGDYVLFNRQPSLHKMSIMGHRVKVLPYSTFRLNLSVTAPYNADFDGDEMNMFVPQNYETIAEVREMMHVSKQIISPQSNKPIMGIVQDTLAGIMIFTYRDTFLDLDLVMNLLMWVEDFNGKIPPPAIFRPIPLWTGKQILSLIIPKINLNKVRGDIGGDDDWNSPKDSRIVIRKGELLTGIVCKKTVGTSHGGLVHVIFNEKGPLAAKDFLSRVQRLVNNWLVTFGHTVGVQDTIAKDSVLKNISIVLKKSKEKVKVKLLKAQDGRLKCQPGKDMLETFEAKVNKVLNDARNEAGKLARQSLDTHNKIILMVVAGSKGNENNISQIMACVGQQNVEGRRIPFGFNRRTLPHFGCDDYGPESKGFVENSYLRGLTPQEFFFHAMGGREGLIDTAVKTSETGYIQRRLEKALEDVMVRYDGTVRGTTEDIVQFIYGEDGIAAEKLEGMKIPLLELSNKQLKRECCFDPFCLKEVNSQPQQFLDQKISNDVLTNSEVHVSLAGEFKAIEEDRQRLRQEIIRHGENQIYLPVNFTRLITKAKQDFDIKPHSKSDLHPFDVVSDIKKLIDSLKVVNDTDEVSKEVNSNALILMKIATRFHLCSKKMIIHDRMSKSSFKWLLGEIKSKFDKAIVHSGEMVGSIAAQSMGEPATQMTLNTFHSAGISSKNVTLGVPRLKEIINVAKNIKTPSLTIHLQRNYSTDQNIMREVQSSIEHTMLEHVIIKNEVYYDPDPEETIISADEDILDLYKIAPSFEDEIPLKELSPWLIRLQLDDSKIMERRLNIEEIRDRIHSFFPRLVNIMHSDINSTDVIMRIRMKDLNNVPISAQSRNDHDPEDELQILKNMVELLKSMSLKGFPEITKVYAKTIAYPYFDEVDGSVKKTEKKNWLLETDGVALAKVMNEHFVEYRKTTSNDINEIYDVLGIEAVRQSILCELRSVLSAYSIYVNYRHIATLCDIMTQRGMLTSITRHGINRVETGPLRRSSFEETVEILLEAAAYAEMDPLRGVSENIIMGQLAPMGTGCFGLMFDKETFKANAISRNLIEDLNNLGGYVKDEERFMFTPLVRYGTERTGPTMAEAFENTNESPIYSEWGTNAVMTPEYIEPSFQNSSVGSRSPSYIRTPYYAPGQSSPSYSIPRSPIYRDSDYSNPSDRPLSPAYSPTTLSSYHPQAYSPTHNARATSPPYLPTTLPPPSFTHTSPQYSPTTSTPLHMHSPSYSPNTPAYQALPSYLPTSTPSLYNPTTPAYTGGAYSASNVKREVKEEEEDDEDDWI